MVERGELPGGEGGGIQQVSQQPDDLAPVDAVLDHPDQDPAGMRALLPGQVHPRQVRPVLQDLDRAGGHAGACPDQQVRPGPRVRLPQRHPGKPPGPDHHPPGPAPPHPDPHPRPPGPPARRPPPAPPGPPPPPQNPPTRASTDACVPVSVSVTPLAWGNPAGWPLASDGPPNAARLAGVSGTSSTNPSTAATRIPCQNAPSSPAGATGPASRRNTASSTPAPSRCRARVNEDLFGIDPPIPSSAPTRFSATSP